MHLEVGDHRELRIRIVVDVGGAEPAVVAKTVVLELHLRRAGCPVEHQNPVVGGHRQVQLSVGIGVDDHDAGPPGVAKLLGLPDHPGLAAIVGDELTLLGFRAAVTEGVAHLEPLQPFYVLQNLSDLEDVARRHCRQGAFSAQVKGLSAHSPGPAVADLAEVDLVRERQVNPPRLPTGVYDDETLPRCNVEAPGFHRSGRAHVPDACRPPAHLPVAAQLQPLPGPRRRGILANQDGQHHPGQRGATAGRQFLSVRLHVVSSLPPPLPCPGNRVRNHRQ